MANHKTQQPTIAHNKSAACCQPVTRNKGNGRNRSFLEGCLFALCCCWLWDACFDL
ncbi:hypothetical protein ES332_A10G217700v1 [Gossypium tomentosum]|uniref:Cysteine-rich transmembrane domain-containing protein n=1 Tax=Gossypium tomentosum TaxID=34277 RepID=A0A5D2NUN7_GOSTO|nr:hypothetical protein ES332_A10G217700v1 [Gossypium tomentosum]